jgi:hypothetical protein
MSGTEIEATATERNLSIEQNFGSLAGGTVAVRRGPRRPS